MTVMYSTDAGFYMHPIPYVEQRVPGGLHHQYPDISKEDMEARRCLNQEHPKGHEASPPYRYIHHNRSRKTSRYPGRSTHRSSATTGRA